MLIHFEKEKKLVINKAKDLYENLLQLETRIGTKHYKTQYTNFYKCLGVKEDAPWDEIGTINIFKLGECVDEQENLEEKVKVRQKRSNILSYLFSDRKQLDNLAEDLGKTVDTYNKNFERVHKDEERLRKKINQLIKN